MSTKVIFDSQGSILMSNVFKIMRDLISQGPMIAFLNSRFLTPGIGKSLGQQELGMFYILFFPQIAFGSSCCKFFKYVNYNYGHTSCGIELLHSWYRRSLNQFDCTLFDYGTAEWASRSHWEATGKKNRTLGDPAGSLMGPYKMKFQPHHVR